MPASVVEMLSVPVCEVDPVALSCTFTVQVAPALRVEPQVPPDAREKPEPETVAVPRVIVPTPVFVRVASAVVLLPAETLPKFTADSVALASWPVPDRARFVVTEPAVADALPE